VVQPGLRHVVDRPALHLSELPVDDREPVHGQDRELRRRAPHAKRPKGEIQMKDPKTTARPVALELEVQEIEAWCNPGCGTSSTDPRCTCPIRLTTTASLFTAKTTS
jgi:hypothetical protein